MYAYVHAAAVTNRTNKHGFCAIFAFYDSVYSNTCIDAF